MTKRREKRSRIAIPVRIVSQDDQGATRVYSACTLDITLKGARLSGVHATTHPGDVIRVERGTNKAAYQVRWVGNRDEGRYGQVGVQCLDSRFDWGVEMAPSEDEHYETRAADPVTQRERSMRHRCAGFAEIAVEGAPANANQVGELGDISTLGCYIRMGFPPKVRSAVKFKITIPQHTTELSGKGVVSTSDKAVGMWVNFTDLSEASANALLDLISKLQTSN